MVNGGTPPEVHIDAELVRSLLRAQRPDLAGLPVVPFANGWDNEMFALGDDLLVRLPRRALAADLVVNEQTWLPVLSPGLPLGVPAPVHAGTPAEGYPWHWSVVPRFPGGPAATALPLVGTEEAVRLAGFLRALHVTAPDDAPANPYRGIPLFDVVDAFSSRKMTLYADLLDRGLDPEEIAGVFFRGMDGFRWMHMPVWLHGDLHAGNIIVDGGRISAVVDWGDICAGDPACDLSIAYSMFSGDSRVALLGAYGDDLGLHGRARAWAVHFGLAYLASGEGDPMIAALGWRALASALLP
ncbi:MAG: aminoglycoside phosphotransferase family protein [Actinomycetota bacterium]